MNDKTTALCVKHTQFRLGLQGALLCLLLSGLGQASMAATNMPIAAKTQLNTVSNDAGAVANKPQTSIPANATEESPEPDSGTLVLLALGLIALGLTRKMARH